MCTHFNCNIKTAHSPLVILAETNMLLWTLFANINAFSQFSGQTIISLLTNLQFSWKIMHTFPNKTYHMFPKLYIDTNRTKQHTILYKYTRYTHLLISSNPILQMPLQFGRFSSQLIKIFRCLFWCHSVCRASCTTCTATEGRRIIHHRICTTLICCNFIWRWCHWTIN